MRRTIILLLALELAGCALGRRLANVPLGLMGAGVVPRAYRPEWGGVIDARELPRETKLEWKPIYSRDHAACYAQGSALQTYSGSVAWSGGTGAGSSHSHFNEGVYLSCMQARGWAYSGYRLVY